MNWFGLQSPSDESILVSVTVSKWFCLPSLKIMEEHLFQITEILRGPNAGNRGQVTLQAGTQQCDTRKVVKAWQRRCDLLTSFSQIGPRFSFVHFTSAGFTSGSSFSVECESLPKTKFTTTTRKFTRLSSERKGYYL